MSDKKISPREAALAVLKKAEELYKSSSLAKGDWAKIHSKLKREGYSEESADKIDGAIKAKLGKSEENPDAAADADLGEKVEQDVAEHEASNKDAQHHEKGSYKLAKFMGKMEMKKGEKANQMSGKTGQLPVKETGMEMGVHTKGNRGASQGISNVGARLRDVPHVSEREGASIKHHAKESHKLMIDEMKNTPKPKLPS